MACTSVTSGRNESCKDNVGGIKNIYIGSFDSQTWDDLVDEGYQADSILDSAELFNAITVYKYELKSDANTFEETNEVSNENQTSFWTQTLTVSLKKQTAESQELIIGMSKGQVVVVIEDYNGTYRAAGLYRGLDVQANTATGGAMGDMNGYTLTFTGVSPYPAYFLDVSEDCHPVQQSVADDNGDALFIINNTVIADN